MGNPSLTDYGELPVASTAIFVSSIARRFRLTGAHQVESRQLRSKSQNRGAICSGLRTPLQRGWNKKLKIRGMKGNTSMSGSDDSAGWYFCRRLTGGPSPEKLGSDLILQSCHQFNRRAKHPQNGVRRNIEVRRAAFGSLAVRIVETFLHVENSALVSQSQRQMARALPRIPPTGVWARNCRTTPHVLFRTRVSQEH